MEIYVYFLISIISVHALYQTTDILLDLYVTNTDENKNECKLIKNKLKTTKNLNTMLLNHYKKPSIGLCTMEFIKQSYKTDIKRRITQLHIYINTKK